MSASLKCEDIKEAYKILKQSLYYENNALLQLKYKIAKFEEEKKILNLQEGEIFFEKLANEINNFDKEPSILEKYFQEISFKKVIKKLNEKKKDLDFLEKLEIYLNKKTTKAIKNKLQLSDKIEYNYFIDCPIELHIISILWLKNLGIKLDKKIKKYSYGYRLEDKNSILFKKYHIQYKKWKNEGIKKIKEIVDENEIAISLNLDLKRFYYNIDHEKLEKKIKKLIDGSNILEDKLTKIILRVNQEYSKKVYKNIQDKKEKIELENEATIIPIGFYSSSVLANFYLNDVDESILKTSPYYYGRYVDDLLIVFKEYNIEDYIENGIFNKKKYLKTKLKFLSNEKNLNELGIKKSFDIENKKHKLDIFKGKEDKTKVLEIENSFLERASTFAFLPSESDVEKLHRKICIVDNLESQGRKYDVSVYLAKILKIFTGIDKNESIEKLKSYAKDICEFFNKGNIIKYSLYFEKVFTLFIMGEFENKIEKFYSSVISYIFSIEEENENRQNIVEYLNNSLLFALALNPKFAFKKKEIWEKIANELIKKQIEVKLNIKDELICIINSNMFKQNMVNYPLINYTDKLSIGKINFFNVRYFDLYNSREKIEDLELDMGKIIFSPRFIHFDEFNIFYLKKQMFKEESVREYRMWFKKIYKESKRLFLNNFSSDNDIIENEIFNKNIFFERDYDKNLNFLKISSQKDKKIESIRVGIASINFFTSLKEVLAGEQKLSIRRKEVIISLLNDAKKNSVKILIFPEISIPFQWLKILNEFSRKNGILITGGLEHLCYYKLPYSSNEKYIFNNLFTILPFSSKNNYKTSITKVRLKNFYAPQEEKEIENSHCKVPKVCDKEYDIFSWQGVYFSNFNCYELTDIESRARLKNYIDLLVASVYNNDLEYFDNILKSTCRDLHVFVAQSNTSKFGDCEILQPTEKNRMIKCKVKSGLNYNLLVDEIEITKLREFQLLKHSLQKERKDFKLTPPGINPDVVKARMNNELEKELQKNLEKEIEKEKELKKELF